MITFGTTTKTPYFSSPLLYLTDEYSFYVKQPQFGRGVSVSINMIELYIDDSFQVIELDGYCPSKGWKKTKLSPPKYTKTGLVVTNLKPENLVQSGVAFSITEESWPTYVNDDGWVCLGDPSDSGDQAIEFLPKRVAVLKSEKLIALWLHPIITTSDSIPEVKIEQWI